MKQNKLDDLKGTNPFKLPEGYMEGLTDQIMSKLPDIPKEEAPEVSLLDRVRPWLYMAAVFVGLLLMFRGFSFLQVTDNTSSGTNDATHQASALNKNLFVDSEEDLEYLEYLENEYVNVAFSEIMANAE